MISAVILAAGPSSRLGRPKQNLTYSGLTLLQHAISNVSHVADQVVVVLGADEEVIAKTITDKAVVILSNPRWLEGMASSIRLAVVHLMSSHTPVSHIICMVCDQPFVTSGFLEELKKTAVSDSYGIVATAYGDTVGVPVIFSAKYFSELIELTGDEGAKKVVMHHQDDLRLISYNKALIDINTEEDYKRLIEGD
jgi:molybdenum cofactor cytidylyltransferase